jgi:PAS domain S-box-containing protein
MRMESKTQPLETSFRDLIEDAPDAMLLVAQDGRIRLVNRQAEKVFGYSRQELLGQPMEMLVPARFREGHLARREGYAAAPRARPMAAGLELFGLRKNTSEFAAEISLSPVNTVEGPMVMAAIRDVSERKRLEELRRAREQVGTRAAKEPAAVPPGVLRWGGLELDRVGLRAFADGALLKLSQLEFKMVSVFLEHPGRVLTREELLRLVWDDGNENVRTGDARVKRLRARLGGHGHAIETVHGVGYRLRAPG